MVPVDVIWSRTRQIWPNFSFTIALIDFMLSLLMTGINFNDVMVIKLIKTNNAFNSKLYAYYNS